MLSSTCSSSFGQTKGLNDKIFMTISKLCKKSSKSDDAGHCGFIRLEIKKKFEKNAQLR